MDLAPAWARAVHIRHLLGLPPRVAVFWVRAWRRMYALDDTWSLGAVTKPRELAPILKLAGDHARVVEVGTGTGWTSIALALAHPQREVFTIDPVHHAPRDAYLTLVGDDVRRRIHFLQTTGDDPSVAVDEVGFVFIDGAHDRDSTMRAFRAWEGRLVPGGVAAFHDFGDANHPGVVEAVDALGLSGTVRDKLFVWRKGLPEGPWRERYATG